MLCCKLERMTSSGVIFIIFDVNVLWARMVLGAANLKGEDHVAAFTNFFGVLIFKILSVSSWDIFFEPEISLVNLF